MQRIQDNHTTLDGEFLAVDRVAKLTGVDARPIRDDEDGGLLPHPARTDKP